MRLTSTAFVLALIVPILVDAGSDFDAECPPNKWVDVGCEVNPHLCQIECTPPQSCAATPELSPCSVGSGTAPMNAAQCEQFCKDSWAVEGQAEQDICRFWRFETIGEVQTCTFFRSSECAAFETCAGDCKCGDAGCYVEGEATPETPVKPCQGGINYNFETDWIHWLCVNDGEPDLPSPYHPEAELPPDTMCYTTHQCADWATETDQKLSVKCDGLTGVWAPSAGEDPNGHYAEILGTQPGPLLEHQCQKEARTPLKVPVASMDPGAQLSCETPAAVDATPPTTYTITPPNKCVLLCDFHLAKVIEGRLSEEGVFKFYITNAEPEVEINDDNVDANIKCWS